MFLTSKFSYLLFPTPPLKLKRGLQIGGRLLKAKHLDQSLWFHYHWAIRNREQQSDHIYFTLLGHVSVRLCCALHQPQQTGHICWAQTNLLSQTGMSTFLHQGTCWALNGVALTIWMSSFCSALKIHYIHSSFLFPSEWKTVAWKLFHRPSLLFQSKIVNISLYQWFHRHCAYLPIQVFMLRPSWEGALFIGRLVARWVLP